MRGKWRSVFRIRPLYLGTPATIFGRIDANCRERQLSCDATLEAIRIPARL